MEKTWKEYTEIVSESYNLLQEKFTQEVKAETKYRDPLMCSKKFELLAGWKFANYAKTN